MKKDAFLGAREERRRAPRLTCAGHKVPTYCISQAAVLQETHSDPLWRMGLWGS